MNKLIKSVEEVIALKEKDFDKSERFRQLEEVNKVLKNLIKDGIVVERGYNLLSINDSSVCTYDANKIL